MVYLSKDHKIREVQIRALQWAKRLRYPEEYQQTLEDRNKELDNPASFFDALLRADRVEARL